MAKSNGAGLKTEIKQKQVAIPITNVILAPYLEKSSREVEEDVLNELKENPLLEKKSDEAEPVVAVHKPETEYDNPDPDSAPYDKPLPGERLYHASNRSVNDEYFAPIAIAEESLEEHLMTQVNELNLSDDDKVIAEYIVGNLDSNGWLVINGGTVTAAACGSSQEAGIDSGMGLCINGRTVAAFGNLYDRIEGGSQHHAVFSFAERLPLRVSKRSFRKSKKSTTVLRLREKCFLLTLIRP